jgi:hypothetical protein
MPDVSLQPARENIPIPILIGGGSVEGLTAYEFILLLATGWRNYLLQRARCFGSGLAKRITRIFRLPLQESFGFELFLAQLGQHPPSAKLLKGFYRAVYTVRLTQSVWPFGSNRLMLTADG